MGPYAMTVRAATVPAAVLAKLRRRTAAEVLASSHVFERSSDQPNTSRVLSRPSMP